MPGRSSRKSQKPRELRRRVVVPARVRQASAWTDVSILNVSSRGLMIHTARPLDPGSWVELSRGDHLINARVVWREGSKAGLQAEDRVPVEAIASGEITCEFRPAGGERTERPKSHDESRLGGRAFEFASVAAVAVMLAAGTLAMVEEALARPLALVAAALR